MNIFIAFILAIVSSMLIDNVVLSRFYGICPFLGVSKKVKSSLGMGIAVVFVIVMATLICYPLYMLLELAHIEFMDTVAYILVIASLVQLVGLFIKKFSPSLYQPAAIGGVVISNRRILFSTPADATGGNLCSTDRKSTRLNSSH